MLLWQLVTLPCLNGNAQPLSPSGWIRFYKVDENGVGVIHELPLP
jgi:hypothetical protein